MKLLRSLSCARRLGLALTVVLAPLGAAAGPFQPGEILVDEYAGNNIQRYSATGTLLQTYTATGTNWAGVALTPDGKLVTTYRSPSANVDLFDAAGNLLTTFSAGSGAMNEVSVFADGTLALSVLNGGAVRLFSQAGVLLSTVTLTGITNPVGSAVGSDNVLYVGGYTSNLIGKVSSSGTFLGSFNVGFTANELVMSPLDGTLWIESSTNTVAHYTTAGVQIGTSFGTGLSGVSYGLGIAPDGLSLYATTTTTTVVRHLSLTGTNLGDFNLTSPSTPFVMTVVPSPEPGSGVLLAMVGAGLLLRRRRRCVTASEDR